MHLVSLFFTFIRIGHLIAIHAFLFVLVLSGRPVLIPIDLIELLQLILGNDACFLIFIFNVEVLAHAF